MSKARVLLKLIVSEPSLKQILTLCNQWEVEPVIVGRELAVVDRERTIAKLAQVALEEKENKMIVTTGITTEFRPIALQFISDPKPDDR